MREFDQSYSMDKQPKAPYYTESLESERRAVVEAFYDHVIAYASAQDQELTVASILAEAEAADEPVQTFDPSACDQLTNMVSVDIKQYPQLLGNEIRVSGCGLFVHVDESDPDTVHSGVLLLEDGESLHGMSADCRVLSIVPYGTYQRLENNAYQGDPEDDGDDQPGPCIVLENAEQLDSSGQPVMTHDWVLVPLTYDSLLFEKVIRQELGQRQSPLAILMSEELRTHFTNVENDLNFNEYEGEESKARHAAHENDLRDRTAALEEQLLWLSGLSTDMLTGEERFLGNDEVEYVQPTIIRRDGEWRVVHGVSVIDPDDGSATPVYLNPGEIIDASWKEEEE